MVEYTFSALNQTSPPIFVDRGKILAISLSGTFSATITIDRFIPEYDNAPDYPAAGSTRWQTVSTDTTPTETKVDFGEGVWYRAKCTVYASGSPKIIMYC